MKHNKNLIMTALLLTALGVPQMSTFAQNELVEDPEQVGYTDEEFDYAELDNQYTWYLDMMKSGEMTEAYVYGRYIRKGAFSRELVAQMVSQGYFTKYVGEMLREDYTWNRLLQKYGYIYTPETPTATFTGDTYSITSVKPFIAYATNKADIYLLPEENTAIGITIEETIPVETTAISSNGYYQIHLSDGYYYVPCNGLSALEPEN